MCYVSFLVNLYTDVCTVFLFPIPTLRFQLIHVVDRAEPSGTMLYNGDDLGTYFNIPLPFDLTTGVWQDSKDTRRLLISLSIYL